MLAVRISLYSLILAGALVGCARTESQVFTRGNVSYDVLWSQEGVRRIKCSGSAVPGGVLSLQITRGRNFKKVTINHSGSDSIWAEEILTSTEDRGKSEGVVFHQSSSNVGGRRVTVQQWTFERDGALIYKEILTNKPQSGRVEPLIFGPFGVQLEPPKSFSRANAK